MKKKPAPKKASTDRQVLNSDTEPFPTEAHESLEGTDGTDGSKDTAGSVERAEGSTADGLPATQTTAGESEIETGDVRFSGTSSDLDGVDKSIESELSSRVSRLPGEGRSGCHERLRRLARAAGLPRGQGPGTAYNWAFEQTDRLFAKLAEPEPVEEPPAEDPEPIPEVLPNFGTTPEIPAVAVVPAPAKPDDGSVSGLSELPPGWPELPANAQLQVEIAWVTANRLRVRDGTGVNLSKALSPAPSYSALSWLETSILFPAKFADISVKATAQSDDEREFIKREKMAIEEIRSILSEMLDAKG